MSLIIQLKTNNYCKTNISITLYKIYNHTELDNKYTYSLFYIELN